PAAVTDVSLGGQRAQLLARLRRWGTRAIATHDPDGHVLGTLPGGTELVFFEGDAVRGASPQIVFGLDAGGIDTAAEGLAARGVQLLTPVTEAPGGWSVEFNDPDGHPLA